VGFVPAGFQWHNGVLMKLPSLGGAANCSGPAWVNDFGEAAGESEISEIDPIVGIKEIRSVVWRNGQIRDLGTLGGVHSAATAINNRGQIVGFATNTIPDPYSFYYSIFPSTNGTQTRAALWQNGKVFDLGTLGGPDAYASQINDSGQIAGWSFMTDAPDPLTGIQASHPFFWENGRMVDMGTLGGTVSSPGSMNSRGQVAGTSNLAGDATNHPFFWDRGVLTDLGTFGGTNGQAMWINEEGDVVGEADFSGDLVHDAFLWRHGKMTDLGNLGQTSFAFYVNSKNQVVGHSQTNDGDYHAFIWQKSGGMVDLNTLIPSNSSLVLRDAYNINDSGVIAGMGLPAGCTDSATCGHAYVLTPCGGSGDITGAAPCPAESGVAEAPVTRSTAAKSASAQPRARMRGPYSRLRLGSR
jgi:probable HAF family extracellular repeat protein